VIVVFAPDSFKGSLSSVEVAEALAKGWRKVRPRDRLRLRPLADGGEGTLAAIETAGGWTWRTARASDPLGRPISARWLRSKDAGRAVIEMAQASGLSLVMSGERDPIGATSLGTGELLRAVLDAGIRRVTLGIGGSATTDGGAGLLRALGATIADNGVTTSVDLSSLDPRTSRTRSSGQAVPPRRTGPRRARPRRTSRRSMPATLASPTRWRPCSGAGSATSRGPAPPVASGSPCCACANTSRASSSALASSSSWS
jgi:hypothetical protein